MPGGGLFRFSVVFTMPDERQSQYESEAYQPTLQAILSGICSKFLYQLEQGGKAHKFHFQCYLTLPRKKTQGSLAVLLYELTSPVFPKGFIDVSPCSAAGSEMLSSYVMKHDETYRCGPWCEKGYVPDVNKALEESKAASPPDPLDRFMRKDCDVKPEDLVSWQRDYVKYVTTTSPPDREIVMFHDTHGQAGKSRFCDHLEFYHEFIILTPGTAADMALGFLNALRALPANKGFKGVAINVARSLFVAVPHIKGQPKPSPPLDARELYQFLEQLKDGRVFSPKYNSRNFRPIPFHLVVFCNDVPPKEYLSHGRLKIIDLSFAPRLKRENDAPSFSLSSSFNVPVPAPASTSPPIAAGDRAVPSISRAELEAMADDFIQNVPVVSESRVPSEADFQSLMDSV